MADSMTVLRNAGPAGTKVNLVVVGDGFTAADQPAFNQWVDDKLIKGVFGSDYFSEDASAFNIYRINLESHDSGVSTRTYDEHGTPTDPSDDTISAETHLDTALDMIFSGSWAHCWLEYGPNTETRLQTALNTWVPDYDEVLVVLNNPAYGGCGGGGRAHVPMGVDWSVIAHEFGHGIGGLADEYSAGGNYTGGEPGAVNVTANTDRATLKWRQFVAPATPVPTDWSVTPRPSTWDSSQDVGLFEGGSTYVTGMYRPVENCRMNGNSPPYCPVCYTAFKRLHDVKAAHHFRDAYAGSFYGSGRSDVLLHHGTSIQMFRNTGSGFEHTFSGVERVPGSWQFKPHDQVIVGDFDGDGRDEVVIFNGVDWAMPYLGLLASDGAGGLRLIARYDGDIPGWGGFRPHDRFFAADLDGDGKKDLVVFNGDDWSMSYVGLLRSTGWGFYQYRRYDGDIPGWGGLARHDQLFVGDVSGDGKDDVVIFNGDDWSMSYVGLFRSTATGLTMTRRYDGDIPGWGGLRKHDRLILSDFDGDGRDDLYITTGDDWSMTYVGMFRAQGYGFAYVRRYDGDVPGWGGLRKHDRFFPADLTGDGKVDLWAWNYQDWSTEYLGRLVSTGTALQASFHGDWVGEWNLGAVDDFEVADFTGTRGTPALYVHNTNWFGVIDGRTGYTLRKIYYRWLHDYRYGRNW
jgi:hypothetical protein